MFGIRNDNDKLYRGIENRNCYVCSLYLFMFLSPCIQYCNFRERFLNNYSM